MVGDRSQLGVDAGRPQHPDEITIIRDADIAF
jgi:hypothetical protein